jgi:hypothetical protein
MNLTSKLSDGVTARSFAWLSDDEFVTEFYARGASTPFEAWTGSASLVGDTDVVDSLALEAFHQANCDMWEDGQNDGDTTDLADSEV